MLSEGVEPPDSAYALYADTSRAAHKIGKKIFRVTLV
jgi:hypothetical protein